MGSRLEVTFRPASLLLIGVAAALVAGCGSSGSSGGGAYSLGGTVAGLSEGAQVTLLNEGTNPVTVMRSGTFKFPGMLASASRYEVTVGTPPAGQACSVAGGSGSVSSANVANVVVTCADRAFALGGSIRGLSSAGLVLANGSDTLAVTAGATQFTLPQPVAYSSSYGVVVKTQPQGSVCAIQGGSGTMPAAAVSSVFVNCAPQGPDTYSVGGTVSGLWATGLVLANGSDLLAVPQRAGVFTMPDTLSAGTHYDIVVQTQPGGLTCLVSNGSGTIGTSSVNDVAVSCGASAYTLGGSVSGLSLSGLLLANGTDRLAVQANALSFTMPTAVAPGTPYELIVQAHPVTVGCGVTNGSGTMGGADVDNVQVACGAGHESTAYTLAPASGDGSTAYGSLLLGSDGNFYALTYIGGTSGLGALIRIAPDGTEAIVHSFAGADGANPHGTLIQASDGNFYGLTAYGGDNNAGVMFRLGSDGSFAVLHSFGSVAGAQNPYGSLLQASDGNLYGLSVNGGANGQGAFFRMGLDGSETVLHSFAGSDGATPFGSLVQASDGNLYGMTTAGGSAGSGTVFRMTLAGAATVLHDFAGGADGASPEGSLIQASDGNLYGLTRDGGANGLGTMFVVRASDSSVSVLFSFGGTGDGANPFGDLLQASDGNLYALTRNGGAQNAGALVQLSPAGTESVVYSFLGTTDGQAPYGSLIETADGTLCGLTSAGGAGGGTAFRFD